MLLRFQLVPAQVLEVLRVYGGLELSVTDLFDVAGHVSFHRLECCGTEDVYDIGQLGGDRQRIIVARHVATEFLSCRTDRTEKSSQALSSLEKVGRSNRIALGLVYWHLSEVLLQRIKVCPSRRI